MNVVNLSIGGPDYLDQPFVEKVFPSLSPLVLLINLGPSSACSLLLVLLQELPSLWLKRKRLINMCESQSLTTPVSNAVGSK